MICDLLQAFADGELRPVDADSVRSHLPDCARCSDRLVGLMQVQAAAWGDAPSLADLVRAYFCELDHFANGDASGEDLHRAETQLRAAVWQSAAEIRGVGDDNAWMDRPLADIRAMPRPGRLRRLWNWLSWR